MVTVNIHEAKTQLSKLLKLVAEGETVVIAHSGTPVAKLTPIEPAAPQRPIGFMSDSSWVIPDNFDTYMQDEIIAMFEGEAD